MDDLIGKIVVLDTTSSYIYVGVLDEIQQDCFVMNKVDVHDRNDVDINKEKYVLETRKYGLKENRNRAYVLREKVVSISALEDVIEF